LIVNAPSLQRSVAQMVDDGAWSPYQKLIVALTALAFAVDGLANQVLGLAIPSLMHDWHAARGAFASVAASGLCAITGAILLGVLPLDPQHGILRVTCALVAEGFFIAGLHNGLYTLASFIYHPFMRATGVGSAAAIGRLGAILSSYTGISSLELGGESAYFIIIAGAVMVALVAVLMIGVHIPATVR